MGNQNVKIFYKVQFDVEEKESDKDRDLLWDIVCHVRRWLERKGDVSSEIGTRAWSKFKTGGRIEEKNNDDFYAESYHRQNPENLDDISWACSINERQKELRSAPRWWTTEIGFKSKENGGARLTFVVSYSNEMGFIGQTLDEPEISVPNIVKNIQADNKLFCSILGKEPIRLKPQKLEVGKGVWFKEMLLSPERVSPIILIMPRRQKSGECIELSIDPELMAASVAGNATVYYSEDMSFVEEMGYLLDTDYRCEEGTVRLYLPHIDTSNSYDYIRHRFIHFHEVQELGKDIVLKIFRRVLAQDINDYDDLFRVSDCQALIQKDKYNKKISIIKQEHARQSAEHTDSIEDLRKQLENVKNDADREMEVVQFIHGEEINDLNQKIFTLNQQIFNMKSRIDQLKVAAAPSQNHEKIFEYIRSVDSHPSSVSSVVDFFANVYSDKIFFTEKCYKSLASCRTEAGVVWEVLFSMVNIFYGLLQDYPFADACNKFEEKVAYTCSPGNSATTKLDKKLMKDYEDVYRGKTIKTESHIVKGNKESNPKFIRLYFSYEHDEEIGDRIVVGSIGGHKVSAATRHKH